MGFGRFASTLFTSATSVSPKRATRRFSVSLPGRGASSSPLIVTTDLDFADIVAASRTAVVSVILLRLRNGFPSPSLARLEAVLLLAAEPLSAGAVVIV
ncbi:MAG: hypothetical protein MUE49_05795, partial [Rhodospirillales bacterium]|nr:hypothetical protein [Rhodospirillales bacterium]